MPPRARGERLREVWLGLVDAEQRGLDLAQALGIAADSGECVVVEKRLAEPYERVREHIRRNRRDEVPLAHLGFDDARDARDRARLHEPGARGEDPQRALLLLRE